MIRWCQSIAFFFWYSFFKWFLQSAFLVCLFMAAFFFTLEKMIPTKIPLFFFVRRWKFPTTLDDACCAADWGAGWVKIFEGSSKELKVDSPQELKMPTKTHGFFWRGSGPKFVWEIPGGPCDKNKCYLVCLFHPIGNTNNVQNPPYGKDPPFTTIFKSIPTGVGFCSSVFLCPLVQA